MVERAKQAEIAQIEKRVAEVTESEKRVIADCDELKQERERRI